MTDLVPAEDIERIVGATVSWPLWQLSAVGARAARLHDRIIEWGERAK